MLTGNAAIHSGKKSVVAHQNDCCLNWLPGILGYPDPTLKPEEVKSVGARLRKQYQWLNDEFVAKLTE
jgi:hypothetical protein